MSEEIRILDSDLALSFFERNRFLFDIGLHLILLSVAISPFIILYLKRKTPVSRLDFYCLLATIIALPFGVAVSFEGLPEYARPFILGYSILCFIVLLISLFFVLWKLQNQSSGSYALNVLGTLFVLGLLIGLLLPAVPSARGAARRMACANNLKQLVLGILIAKDKHVAARKAPTNNAPEFEGGPEVSWRVKLLPYIEQQGLRDAYNSEQNWESDENWEVAKKRLGIYTCPAEPPQMNRKGGRYTSYAMLRNSNLAEDNPKLVKPQDAQIQIMESCGANLIWTEPRDVDLDTFKWSLAPESEAVQKKPWNSRNIGASAHPGGTQAAFVDGSVRFLSQETDPELLRSLILGDVSREALDDF